MVNLVIDKQSGQELAVKLLPKVRGKLSKVCSTLEFDCGLATPAADTDA